MGPADVLDYWFGRSLTDPGALPERMGFWFGVEGDSPEDVAARDDDLRRRCGPLVERLERGELAAWEHEPRGRLALILLTDQWPRNVHRGSARAYAGDDAARRLCLDGLALGHDRPLKPLERLFFYLPLEHSESLADQERAVALIGALEQHAPPGAQEMPTVNNTARIIIEGEIQCGTTGLPTIISNSFRIYDILKTLSL